MSVPLTTISLQPAKFTDKSQVIQMSSTLIQQLHLNIEADLTVIIGKKSIALYIETAELSANEVKLSESMIKEFGLPIQPLQLHAAVDKDKRTLKLGPIIGLLTEYDLDSGGRPQFRSVHMFCEELHHGISEYGGFFYVFSFKDFPQKGFYFKDGKWFSGVLAMPDVIYNRIHSRKLEHSAVFKKFRNKLEDLSIPLFNDRFLSKWEVYEQLIQESYLHPFLPETKLFSKDNLIDLAGKYNTVFIKPIHGSQGKNIIKLVKTDENHYLYQTSVQTISQGLEKIFRREDLYQQIKPILGNRIYIIQQGIPLLNYKGCAIDFRALCHKTILNQWQVTSLVARISSEQEFVSNIARGGQIIKPLKAFQDQMNRTQALDTLKLMKELAIKTSDTINKYSSGIVGELGIDIGVDLEGNVQLIEVNFKPSKNFEDGLMKIRPSARAIIQFCSMLSFDSEADWRNQL
jgi:glutathione synthase/RimK-type ligase-like ATP-grasp enzyme